MEKNIVNLNIDSIFPNLYQPRKHFDEDAIDELAQSIQSYGIIQPISVRKLGNDKYELVAGERRLRAAKKLGKGNIPAIIVDITDRDSAAIALLENLQREDLNFLEEGEAYINLMKDHGYTQERLAEVIGKKQSTIANKIRILKLDEFIRKELLQNNLTERHARALLKLDDINIQKKVLKRIIDKELNVKETEELIEYEIEKSNSSLVVKNKRIKGNISPRLYVNTVRQVFEKFGVNAKYVSKEIDDKIEITITILK
ncbi:MAG TPA: nucleoid occlusion protein [Clostridiaceae bacterium]